MSRIPVTVLTGFLGAGKTTLLKSLLTQSAGLKIGVIVNEFGEVGFDGTLVRECAEEGCVEGEFVELTNGCICCTVAEDFIPTMNKLLSRQQPLDAIVVETSGLALPQPLLKAFTWPDIRTRSTVDGVVTVVDALALSEGRVATDEAALKQQRGADASLEHDDPIEEVFEDQLVCADLVVLSKSDLVAPDVLDAIERKLANSLRGKVRIVRSRGELAPRVLIGIDAAAEEDLSARAGHHDDEEEHDHDDFESIVVDTSSASPEELKARVSKVLQLDGVIRVKGFTRITGRTSAAMVQAVGARVEISFARPDFSPTPGIVVIGLKGFDHAAARKLLGGAS